MLWIVESWFSFLEFKNKQVSIYRYVGKNQFVCHFTQRSHSALETSRTNVPSNAVYLPSEYWPLRKIMRNVF